MKRRLAGGLGMALACAVLWSAPASAATQVGQTTGSMPCGAQTVFQTGTPSGPQAAPAAELLTSWQYRSPMMSQIGRALEFKVARSAGGNALTIVGESERETPTIPLSDLSFPTRISVQAGDIIGLYVPGTQAPYSVGPSPGYPSLAISDIVDRPAGDTSIYNPGTQTPVNVAAILEPDCDNDGFGDETQDAVADCAAPDTQITKGPKDRTRKKRATFEFSGTDARTVTGLECSLDGAPFASCASPLTVRVRKGRHTFSVRATDAGANADGTPATDEWKVKRKRRHG